jgi:hypothetical protein
MNSKLYYRAYKFLKIRSTNGNPFQAIENLQKEEKQKVMHFLSYNHQVKFI